MEEVYVGGERRPLSATRCTTGKRERIAESLGRVLGLLAVETAVLAT